MLKRLASCSIRIAIRPSGEETIAGAALAQANGNRSGTTTGAIEVNSIFMSPGKSAFGHGIAAVVESHCAAAQPSSPCCA
jgi:hypothetical protein